MNHNLKAELINSLDIKMVISDLDETLLPKGGEISAKSRRSFEQLSDNGITRVIATGRNLFSALNAIPANFPIDYLIFSTGIGCINWKNQDIIFSAKLNQLTVKYEIDKLFTMPFPFFLLNTVPNNHFQSYFGPKSHPELNLRLRMYDGFTKRINRNIYKHIDFSQILIMIGNMKNAFNNFIELFTNENVILTSSPLISGNFWVEVIPSGISKGLTVNRLCNTLGFNSANCLAIGNDYNDIDLLNWAGTKFIVENAPADLVKAYPLAPSCNNDGVHHIINRLINNKL